MTRVESALVRVAADLDALGASWALVGGLAVSVWAEPRLTRDIDVAIAVSSDREAEQLIRELCGRGWEVIVLVEQEAIERLATARLTCSDRSFEGIILDLLFASSGIEPEIVDGATMVDIISEVRLPVASRAHLIAMKLLARDDRSRPQDADDLRSLIQGASPEEISAARRAIDSITQRGFHRKRDLGTQLDHEIELCTDS